MSPGERAAPRFLHPRVRSSVASALALVATYALYRSISRDWTVLGLPLSLLLASGLLVHRRALAPQVLARAVWWSNLALAVVLATSGSRRELDAGALLASSCGGALLVAGGRALSDANERAAAVPPALRSVLLLLMVLALADAQTLLLFASVGFIEGSTKLGIPALMLALGALYVAGFVGLYRLRLWGAISNLVVSLLVLAMLLLTSLVEKRELVLFLGSLAALHVAVALPVVVASLRGKELRGLSPRLRSVLAHGVILALMAFGLLQWGRHHRRERAYD